MFGVSIGPPKHDIAENPTSSSTIYTTLGAPAGAFGGSNGAQSGTESLISTLIVPLNGALIAPPCHSAFPACPDLSRSRCAAGPGERSRGTGRPDGAGGPTARCHQRPVSARYLLATSAFVM